ncbi:hypothetical protein JTE90_023423 [Oedothorax gibbosus]|uniref:Solute carrier family 35 member F5 n=1 Tax=Oedothorax gibbosus TaxID=931172 RepID=A0AAV6U369_9ARAC|nr:hypothetical protein JTE90_023423 [Oedothorax gibbosus]
MAKLNAHRLFCGTLVLLIVDVIWVGSSELTEYIFKDENFSKPFFSTYVKTTMFVLYLLGFVFWKPWRNQCSSKPMYTIVDPTVTETEETERIYADIEAEPLLSDSVWIPIKYHDGSGEKSSGNESEDSISRSSIKSVHFNQVTEVRHLSESQADDALLARLSYSASLRAQESALKAANKLPMKQVARIALLFCVLWFLGNLSYQEALSNTEAGVVNILSCSSGLFTLILASMFPSNSGDRLTLSKFLAVGMSIVGVTIISNADKGVQNYFPPGAVWSILGAFFYAAYVVLLRRKVDNEDMLDIPMFFGFVGLFNLLFMHCLLRTTLVVGLLSYIIFDSYIVSFVNYSFNHLFRHFSKKEAKSKWLKAITKSRRTKSKHGFTTDLHVCTSMLIPPFENVLFKKLEMLLQY